MKLFADWVGVLRADGGGAGGGIWGLKRVFMNKGLRFFGKYSYGIYVFHALFLPVMLKSAIGPERIGQVMGSEVGGRLGFFVVASLISVGMALVSWSVWEEHFVRLKRYF